MATSSLRRTMPAPLPEKIEEWQRFLKQERTLNDLVEDIHRILVADEEQGPQYRAFLRAVYDEQAVEGSLSADNYFAADMIRKKARALDPAHDLVDQKAATISKALNIVMRRYHSSRKERRYMLEGEVMPPEGNGDHE